MNRLLLTFSLISIFFTLRAQQQTVSIGTEQTNSKAILWLKSENQNQGLIIPIVNSKLAVGSLGDAEKGMIVFSLEDNNLHYWNGTSWNVVGSGTGGGGQTLSFDVDNNKIVLSGNGGSINLADTKPNVAGQILFWDGTKWNSSVNIAPSNGQVLKWNGTSWQAQSDDTGVGTVPTLNNGEILWGDGTQNLHTPLLGDASLNAQTLTIKNDAINSAKIADGSVTTTDIQDSGITGADIENATIPIGKLAPSSANEGQVLKFVGGVWVAASDDTGTGTLPSLAQNQIVSNNGSSNIAVTVGGDLGFNATSGAFTIVNDAVDGSKISDGSVTATEIANGAIDNTKLAADAVQTGNIANGTITGADISDATITVNKIAQSGAVDGDVLTYDQASSAWKPKAATGAGASYTAGTGIAIDGSNVISVSSISANEIAADAVGNSEIATDAVGSPEIATDAVGSAEIAADAVTASEIASNTITGSELATNITFTTTGAITTSGGITTNDININTINYTWPSTDGASTSYLSNDGNGNLSWSGVAASGITGTMAVGNGGTGLSTTPANNQLLVGNGTGYSLSTLTAGTNITFSNAGGLLTINSTASGLANPMTTTGDVIYSTNNSGAPGRLAGAAGFLKSTGAAAPSWSAINLASSDVTGTLPLAQGGTGITTTPAANQLLVGTGTGYALSTLTAGTNVTFSNVGGLLTINSTASGLANPMTTTGDLIYSTNNSGTPARLAGSAGVLKSTGAAAPSWGAVNLASSDVTGTLPLGQGGTGITSTPAANQLLVGTGTGYSLSTLTAGTNISLSNVGGLLTISSSALSNPMTATGDIIYSTNGTGTPARLAGAAGFLKSTGAAAPTWSAIALGGTDVSGTLPVARGGTNLSTTPTNGQLLIGNGTNYSLSTLTGGTGISITNGAGSISVATSGNFGTQNLTTTGTLSTGGITATDIDINTINYTWPNSDGTSTAVLTNDGNGNLSWAAPASFSAGSGLTLTGSTFDLGGTLSSTPKFTNTTGNVTMEMVSQNTAVNTKSGFNLRSDAGYTGVQWEIMSRKSDAIANSGNSDLYFSKLFSTAGGYMDMLKLDGGTNDVIINGSKTTAIPYGNLLLSNGNFGIGTTTPNGSLQFSNVFANRKIVLNELANNDHQYSGFGTAAGVLIYHVPNVTDAHVFYGGATATSSAEMFRIQGEYVSTGGRFTPIKFAGVNSSFDVQTDNGSGLGGMSVDANDPDGQAFYGYSIEGNGKAYTYYDGTYGNWIVNNNGGNNLVISNSGYTGVGNYATGIAPSRPLEVLTATGATDYGLSQSNGTVRMSTFIGTLGGGGVGGSIGTESNHPFYIYVANSGAKAAFLQNGGLTVGGTFAGSGAAAPANGLTVEGNVGLGINTPDTRLHLYQGTGPSTGSTNSLVAALIESNSQSFLEFNAASYAGVSFNDDNQSIRAGMFFDYGNDAIMFKTGGVDNRVVISEAGDVQISASNDYKYASAKTQNLSVSHAAFTIAASNTSVMAHRSVSGQPYILRTQGGTATNQTHFVAPVYLPDGAVVTTLLGQLFDSDATYNASVTLVRQLITSSINSDMAVVTSSGTPGLTTLSTSSITNATIDNSLYAYLLVFETMEANTSLGLYNAKITYTVTNVD